MARGANPITRNRWTRSTPHWTQASTADVYSQGESEIIVGKALAKGRRDDVVLATKVNVQMDVPVVHQPPALSNPFLRRRRGRMRGFAATSTAFSDVGSKDGESLYVRSLAGPRGCRGVRCWMLDN